MLPADRYIASLLGLTEEQYEFWKDYVDKKAKEGPQPAIVCGEPSTTIAIVSLVLTIIGTGLQIIGTLLQRDQQPAELKGKQRTGNNQTGITSFAPRAGFDAVQDVAAIGAPIPAVYAYRETIGGQVYGGVRVNVSLLWSQIWSLGGSQMLRAVFMIGEGKVLALDSKGFAIGDNTIGSYDLLNNSANEDGSRLTIYFANNGGRIKSSDYFVGRIAAQDIGNAQADTGDDVFQLKSTGNTWESDFSASIKPNNSTTFGVYSPIGNNLGFKLNPTVRPGYAARLKPEGDDGDAIVACDKDDVVEVQRKKFAAFFSSRSGVTSGSFGLGDTFTYKLLRSSDYDTVFEASLEDDDTWNVSIEVRDFEGAYLRPSYSTILPGLQGAATIQALENAIILGTPTVNTANRTISVQVTLEVNEIEAIYEDATDGTYKIQYWIKAKNNGRKLDLDLRFNAIVTVRSARTFIRDGSGDNIDFTNSTFSIGTQINENAFADKVDVNLRLSSTKEAANLAAFPANGKANVIYIARDTKINYYWNGTTYANVLNSGNLSAKLVFDYSDKDVYSETADDAASSIAARQKSWDDSIIVGEVYKIGSALAVCTSRTEDIFRSDSELESVNSGIEITAGFKVVRAGTLGAKGVPGQATLEQNGLTEDPTRETGTSAPHLMRAAIANIATSRSCRVVEIGIRSSLGIDINGLLRFRSTLSFQEADGRACLNYEDDSVKRGNTLKTDQYQSGVTTTTENRYSFFRVSYRKYGEANFTAFPHCFGVGSQTKQPVFNYLRLVMPSLARWEIRIEPLSGWEIRTTAATATGNLYLLDARLDSEIVITEGSATIRSNGQTVSRSQQEFRLRQTRRAQLGYGDYPMPHADTDNNYADSWGKLAEIFVYEQIQSSASGGPEHEIVYVNEIIKNTPNIPEYDNLALIGLNIRSAFEWAQFRQFSAYVNQGTEIRRLRNNLSLGASHLFPDVALDRFTNSRYGLKRVTDEQIDLASFEAAADWCYERKYFFDGPVMLGTNSARQWAADVAATMLLDFREVSGRYSLSPAITFSPVEHKALFTAGNVEDFKFETIQKDETRSIQVSAKWREERLSSELDNPGLFPVEREVLVREASPIGSDEDQVDSIDLSDYVTNENHAIDACKFKIRSNRLRDHVIKFTTTYDGLKGVCSGLAPGDYIKVAMDTTVYNEFNNGVVLKDGTIVCSSTLAPGSYNVIAWDGTENYPADENLIVDAEGKGNLIQNIFTVKQINSQVKTYQITRITPTDEGKFEIEALHAPVNSSGVLLMAVGWDNGGNWEISR